jgi:hypothetical protein
MWMLALVVGYGDVGLDAGCWYVCCLLDVLCPRYGLGFSVVEVAKHRLPSKQKKAS